MDYHLERRLLLNSNPEYKNLYDWAIKEIDADGRVVGRDQIPWPWTLHFRAISCQIVDSLDVNAKSPLDKIATAPLEITHRQLLRAKLRPDDSRDERFLSRQTTYSMFGTNRAIKNFELEIHPITNPAEQERCMAWGTVSYTAEIDFTNETTEDCLVFYLFVRPEMFSNYAAKFSQGAVNELMLSVGVVSGFYSDWSPSVSTDEVKVLTAGEEQEIDLPLDIQVELPRLGEVGRASLFINRRIEFFSQSPQAEMIEGTPDVEKLPMVNSAPVSAAVFAKALPTLASIKRAAWVVVTLVALIFIVLLLKQ